MTKKRGRGHLKRPHRPAVATLPERAELEGLPPHDADGYDWVYDAEGRHLVHEYWWGVGRERGGPRVPPNRPQGAPPGQRLGPRAVGPGPCIPVHRPQTAPFP